MGYQEEIDRIDQRLADMDYVQAAMTEQGVSLGEYDLDSMASLRARERGKEEELAKQAEQEVMLQSEGVQAEAHTEGDPPDEGGHVKYETEIATKATGDEAEFEASLAKIREAQEILTPVLLDKYKDSPTVKTSYDYGSKQRALKERVRLFGMLKDHYKATGKSYQLSHDEMKKALGDDKYKEYMAAMGNVMGSNVSKYPELSQVAGTKEGVGQVPMYGLKSALFSQYGGGPLSTEETQANIDWYSEWSKRQKEGKIENVIDD